MRETELAPPAQTGGRGVIDAPALTVILVVTAGPAGSCAVCVTRRAANLPVKAVTYLRCKLGSCSSFKPILVFVPIVSDSPCCDENDII